MKRAITLLLFWVILGLTVMAFGEGQGSQPGVAAGDIISFGHYEQDNNPDNGPEPIEWIVLDVQDGKVLLLSRYGLDAQPYNLEYTDITWEKCYLRSWLNGFFLNEAFTAEEQSAVLMTTVDNSAGQGYSKWDTNGGNDTQDQIFLLSYAEANRYLDVKVWREDYGSNIRSRVAPTAYAIAQGANTSDSSDCLTAENTASGHWFLRSPGPWLNYTAEVYHDGSLQSTNVYSVGDAVRPAFWLDLNAGV